MKDRSIAGVLVGILALGGAFATRSTDVIFVAASIAFFVLCIGYAEWCGRL